jgi:hypothetical protein
MSTGHAPGQAPSLSEPVEKPDREGTELIAAAARAGEKGAKDTLSEQERQDALDWFLSDEQEAITHTFQINVGSVDRPHWIDWTIRPVDMDRLRKIRKQSQPRGRRANATDFDENTANVQIILEGTVYPDLRAAAKQIGVVDPTDAVKTRFARKPGLVAQISSKIMDLSGYDDEDVREVDAASGL